MKLNIALAIIIALVVAWQIKEQRWWETYFATAKVIAEQETQKTSGQRGYEDFTITAPVVKFNRFESKGF